MAVGQYDLTRQTGTRLAMTGRVQQIVFILGEAATITILDVDVTCCAGAAPTTECKKLVKTVVADRFHERNASVGGYRGRKALPVYNV